MTELTDLSVRALRARRRRLAAGLSDVETLLRGRLVRQSRRCGKPGCHCVDGELHGPYLSVYEQGRSRTVYVPAPLEPVVAEHVSVTQRNEQLLSGISQINLELLRRRALG